MIMSKRWFLVIFLFCFISTVSALCDLPDADIGTVQQNTCIRLWQTCADCSGVNISEVVGPPSQSLYLSNVVMTKIGTSYNYSFCNTSIQGSYVYKTFGNSTSNGICTQNIHFEVNGSGDVLTEGESILYLFILFGGIGLFCLWVYLFLHTDSTHITNEQDIIIKVNYKYHLKLLFIVLMYLTLMWINWLAWNITLGYLPIYGASQFFKAIYWIQLAFMLPIFVAYVIISVIVYLRQRKLEELISKQVLWDA